MGNSRRRRPTASWIALRPPPSVARSHFANTPNAVGMCVVGDFDDHRVDHRQVRCHRHAIVQEARIVESPGRIEDVLLVERPADALGDPALHLALHVAGVDGTAGILHRGVADHIDATGLLVDFDIADVRGERRCRALRVHRHLRGNRAARLCRLCGEIRERQRLEVTGVGAGRMGVAVLPVDRLRVNVPEHRCTFAHLLDHPFRGFRYRCSGRERHAAAARRGAEADAVGVAHLRADVPIVNAERFGNDVHHGRARPADVRMPGRHRNSTVLVDVDLRARFATDVEPEAAGHAAALTVLV